MRADPCAPGGAREQRPTGIPRQLSLLVVAALAFAAALLPGGALPAPSAARAATAAASQTPLSGLLVTLAASGEYLPSAAGAGPSGLLLQVSLDNETGSDLAGIGLRSPVPAHTHITDSWLGQQGQNPGTVEGAAVGWSEIALAAGGRVGPFTYRVVPDQDADGATVFRAAVVQPRITVSDAVSPAALPLIGLWGEGNLRRTLLPSGLTVLTVERPDTPTVALKMAVRAGSRDESEITCGGSHWLEHAHFLGTQTRPDNQAIIGAIANVGGQINASTGWEYTDYYDLVPADQFTLALDVLSDQLLNSTFLPQSFDRERLVVRQEHLRRNDDPTVHAFDLFINNVFRVSPLRRNPGDVACLSALPLQTILAYHAARYITGNMVIAASGNLSHDDTVARIAQAFAAMPRGDRAVRAVVAEPVETGLRRIEDGAGTQLAELRIGWPGPGDGDPDFPAFTVLDSILGAVGQRLTRSGGTVPATGISSRILDFSDASALMISARGQAKQADVLAIELVASVRRVADDGVTDAEVQTSVQAIAGLQARSTETNLSQVSRADLEVSGTIESYAEYVARLRTVTAADVQRVARTYLDPSHYTLVIVRP